MLDHKVFANSMTFFILSMWNIFWDREKQIKIFLKLWTRFLHMFSKVWKHESARILQNVFHTFLLHTPCFFISFPKFESMRILHNVLFCAMLTLRTRENVTNLPLICCYMVCGYCLLILLQKERFWMQKSTESLSFVLLP